MNRVSVLQIIKNRIHINGGKLEVALENETKDASMDLHKLPRPKRMDS